MLENIKTIRCKLCGSLIYEPLSNPGCKCKCKRPKPKEDSTSDIFIDWYGRITECPDGTILTGTEGIV